MWLVGVGALLLTTSFLAALLGSQGAKESSPRALENLPVVAPAYSQLAGSLASLCLAAVVFIASFSSDSAAFDTSIGLFILAFLVLVASAMEYAVTPTVTDALQPDGLSGQYLSYLLADLSFYPGLALSWLGLRLLVLAIHLDDVADLLTWVLLFAIVLGSLRIVMHLYRYTRAGASACLGLVAVSFAAGLVYRFVLTSAWDDLWPSHDGPLRLAVVVFAFTGLGYIYQTLLFGIDEDGRLSQVLKQYRSAWLFAYTQGVLTVVVLAWIAVAQT